MRLGLNQPYFFPYIGHFSLIKHVDIYFLLDTVQYISGGWINRNRILKPNSGWQYFGVPTLKHHHTECLKTVKLNNEIDWRLRIYKQLEHYKKAPYYIQTLSLLQNILEKPYTTICELDTEITKQICDFLGIHTPIFSLSESGLKFDPPSCADEWGLTISQAIDGITEYWNAPGGAKFYDRQKYEQVGIQIFFQKMILKEYPQKKGASFIEGLSILDVLMYNDIEEINELMEYYEFI